MKKERFELRRYHPSTQSNVAVGVFEETITATNWHFFDLKDSSGNDDVVFQVYPNDPTKCFYLPIPAGMAWYLYGNKTECMVSIPCHDHYAFFSIPKHILRLDWVLASSAKEALEIIQ
jgi:hypothetical protein